jgi:hypothetical protein
VGGDRRYRVPMTEYLPDYEHRGDPLAKHILTTADQRTQAKAERTAEFIRLIVDNAPPLSREDADEIWRLLPSSPPPRDLMRWRVRLYCGHVVERKAHRTHTTIGSALDVGSACPTCGLDPATIVAGVPLGLTSDSTNPQPASAKLEAELARVSRRLPLPNASIVTSVLKLCGYVSSSMRLAQEAAATFLGLSPPPEARWFTDVAAAQSVTLMIPPGCRCGPICWSSPPGKPTNGCGNRRIVDSARPATRISR